MSANTFKGFTGTLTLMKVSGSGAVTAGTEITIPFYEASHPEPSNDSYPPMVNKASSPSLVIRGMHTPSLAIRTQAKVSWFTPAWLNSLIVTQDTAGDSDLFACKMVMSDTIVYDGMRCANLGLTFNAAGGGIGVDIGFIAQSASGTTVFASTPAIDAGDMIHSANVDYGSTATADLVKAWKLTLVRPQAYDFFSGRVSYDPTGVSSGMLAGAFELQQSAKAATIPSSAATIRVYSGVPTSTTTVASFALNLNQDRVVRTHNVGFEDKLREYSLINASTGAVPVAIT